MKEGEVIEVTKAKERRSYIKEGEGTSEGTKREIFLFGIVLLFWPSLIKCFDFVDLFGFPSMPKREIVDIWLKQAHLFTKREIVEYSFNHYFFTDVKLAHYR